MSPLGATQVRHCGPWARSRTPDPWISSLFHRRFPRRAAQGSPRGRWGMDAQAPRPPHPLPGASAHPDRRRDSFPNGARQPPRRVEKRGDIREVGPRPRNLRRGAAHPPLRAVPGCCAPTTRAAIGDTKGLGTLDFRAPTGAGVSRSGDKTGRSPRLEFHRCGRTPVRRRSPLSAGGATDAAWSVAWA